MSPSMPRPSQHLPLHRRQQGPPAFPSRANLGPLTTTFTQPPRCTRPALDCPLCGVARQGQSCAPGPVDDTACWPSATSYPNLATFEGLGFYSPGLICPTGFVAACTAARPTPTGNGPAAAVITQGPLANGKFQFPLLMGETAVGCCPTGFTCTTDAELGWQTCHKVASSTTLDLMTCRDNNADGTIDGFAVPFTASGQVMSRLEFYAPLIQINWQASDVVLARSSVAEPMVTTSTGPITSVQRNSASRTETPLASEPPSALPASSSSGLSTPGVVGIAVSGGVVFFALLGSLAFLWLRKRWIFKPFRIDAVNHPPIAKPPPSAASSAVPDDYPATTAATAIGGKIHTLNAFTTPVAENSTLRPASSLSLTSAFPLPPSSNNNLERNWQPISDRPSTTYPNEPAVLPSAKFARQNKPPLDIDMQAARFGGTLGVEDALESPIDSSSPFRLKRGDTLRRKHLMNGGVGIGVPRARIRENEPSKLRISTLGAELDGREIGRDDRELGSRDRGSDPVMAHIEETIDWAERSRSAGGLVL